MTNEEYFDKAMASILEEIEILKTCKPICPMCHKPAAVIVINGTMLDSTITAMCEVHGTIRPIGEI